MSTDNYRKERIHRLLQELEYELTRGVMDREIPEEMTARFYIPSSVRGKDWMVGFSFELRPMPVWSAPMDTGPRLKLIVGGKE